MDTQGLVMDGGFDQYQQLQQQLAQMSQKEIDQMNSVLSQFQLMPPAVGSEGLDSDNLFGDDENYHFSQQQARQQAQQQHTMYLQSIYIQQLREQNEQMRQIQESMSRGRTMKQRNASSSPKKTGRFESIYATLRNKATNMRRSRTAFMHEAVPSTVAPMALLNDAGMPEGIVNKNHHAHYRSHHPDDLDLDLDLSNAHAAAMGHYPPTPPLTGTLSSLSSTSSTSASGCSSVASSVGGDAPQFHHLVAAQIPQHSLQNHHHRVDHNQNVSEENLHPADMANFVSGLVDDPFGADTNALFGGGGHPGPQPHPQHAMLALRPHVKTEYPPQPQSQSQPPLSGVSSACWPVTASTPSGKGSPQHLQDDNDVTPVTAAINIPGRSNGLQVSPSAYLANAAANMSGSSVIASASATAALAAMAAGMKPDPSSMAMDTDEDWWQSSVVESAVGDPLEQSTKSSEADGLYTTSSMPTGFPPEFIAANPQAFDANGNLVFYMPDMATNGLMIHMPPSSGATTPGSQQNQYYFPGITSNTGFPPPPPMPATEHEYRHDHRATTNGGSRRPKPRAPSAGARYHSSRGDGLHSPRKRSSVTNLPTVSSNDDGSGISAAAMTAPSTPRGHQLGRRSHSMQALPRTSPTPGGGSFNTLPSGATTPSNGAIRKRRSASNMRRVSSTQGITSLTAAAAIATAVGASTTEPKTPSRRQRSTSAEASRPRSAASNGGLEIGFVNFTPHDHKSLMNGVAPSGSSKTKARRERELQEKTRKFSERLVRAMAETGDKDAAMRQLEAEGLNDLGAIAL
ncbi:hypothetical protein Sste5346_000416 [Sporothrix stenoceras]|uniref:Developmental regulatory protein wetA n=1 Tax=Sporothrix stenoceras TaxID=5173 RepID=A0ABR3ZSG0_9PEZI